MILYVRRFLCLTVLLLVSVGLVVLASATKSSDIGLGNSLVKQLMYLVIGVVGMVAIAFFDYHWWRDVKWHGMSILLILLYLTVLVALLAVFFFKPINGSHRWIEIGDFKIQPSEFAKLSVVVIASVMLDGIGRRIVDFWRGKVWCVMLMIAMVMGLVFCETDMGAAVVLGLIVGVLCFVAGMRMSHAFISVATVLLVVAVLLVSIPNRRARFIAWLPDAVMTHLPESFYTLMSKRDVNVLSDRTLEVVPESVLELLSQSRLPTLSDNVLERLPESVLTNLSNATMMRLSDKTLARLPSSRLSLLSDKVLWRLPESELGRLDAETLQRYEKLQVRFAGMEKKPVKYTPKESDAEYQANMAERGIRLGKWFGDGFNSALFRYYTPEQRTDFIFSVGAEEFGFLFSASVIILYLLFLSCGMYVAFHAVDRLGFYMAYGMTFLLSFQAFFNVGMVVRFLPTKGIALPFISYGGTNLMVALFATGVIYNVAKQIGLPNHERRCKKTPILIQGE